MGQYDNDPTKSVGDNRRRQIQALKDSGELPSSYTWYGTDANAGDPNSTDAFDAAMRRAKLKEKQYGFLDQQTAPSYTPQVQARIKALESESQPTTLAEDPYFQGQRSTIVRGGERALASVQNTQRAAGTAGGFRNQGSIADVYDRLGGQLADLGGKSVALKSAKADQAAQMHQSLADAQTAYQNAVLQAKSAIESGDAAAAQAAIQAAIQAKETHDQATRAFWGNVIGGVVTAGGAVAGGALAGGAKAAATAGAGVAGGAAQMTSANGSGEFGGAPYSGGYGPGAPNLDPSMGGYDPRISMPWAYQRSR